MRDVYVDDLEDALGELVRLKQPARLEHFPRIRSRSTSKVDADKALNVFNAFVWKTEELPPSVSPQHPL